MTTFGPDEEPATADDACAPAQDAAWSVDPAGVASLGQDEAARVRLSADAPIDEAKVIAQIGDRKDSARLSITAPETVAGPPVVAGPAVVVEEPKPDLRPTDDPGVDGATAGGSPVDTTPRKASTAEVGAAAALGGPTAQVVAAADATTVSASPMAAEDFIITPQSTVTITGSVATSPSGTPLIAGATVTATCTGCNGTPTVSYTGGGTSTNATGGFAVSVTYPGSGPATVTMTASAPGYSSVPQSSASRTCADNGSSCSATPVTLLLAPAVPADLGITKTDSPDPVIAGSNLTYTITVRNAGPGVSAAGIVMSDALPAGTTFVSARPGQWHRVHLHDASRGRHGHRQLHEHRLLRRERHQDLHARGQGRRERHLQRLQHRHRHRHDP